MSYRSPDEYLDSLRRSGATTPSSDGFDLATSDNDEQSSSFGNLGGSDLGSAGLGGSAGGLGDVGGLGLDLLIGQVFSASDTRSMLSLAKSIALQDDMTPADAAKLELFAQARSIGEQNVLIYGKMLQINTNQKRALKADAYAIPSTFKPTMKAYSFAYLFGTRSAVFKGEHQAPAKCVMAAMRLNSANAPSLPRSDDITGGKVLLAELSSEVTHARNSIKDKAKASMQPGSKMRNIGALAHAILNGVADVPITLMVYMKLAFIRFCLSTFQGVSDSDFWWRLHEFRVAAANANHGGVLNNVDLIHVLSNVYNDDRNTYGDPAESGYQAVEIAKLSVWHTTLAQQAATVKPALGKRGREAD
uniref:Uncharacterized protein n=1 Tax=Mycena chlorophos TaxID=658473 RepID=A0ABQ0KWR3_MYCCL|nr:predicted protein [Mycena chlorophos]